VRRLARQRRASQGSCLPVGLFPQLVVPLSSFDALELALQALIPVLLGPDLLGNFVAVRGIQLGDELGDQVLVLERFLDGGQARALPLPLGRVGAVGGVRVAIGGMLMLEFLLQPLEVEVAQGIGTETAGLEVLVGGDVRVLLQQVGYAGEDGGADAIGMEALEQQKRLEVGVGRDASRHPPGVCSARAMGVGRDGSHGDEDEGVQRRQTSIARDGGGGRWAMGASGGEAVADGLVGLFDEEIILRKSFVGGACCGAAVQPSPTDTQSLVCQSDASGPALSRARGAQACGA
jgi:hypothetical protein